MAFRYLGASYDGFLVERDRQFYRQGNDCGFQKTYSQQSMTLAKADKIRTCGRERYVKDLDTWCQGHTLSSLGLPVLRGLVCHEAQR